ncbi:MAG: hypothetical protein LBU80_06655 [Rikenellaceae bacterium]|jgi:hypothetical protein|nr:hypothetical protein [Rikenellaceae bacterium]
MKSQKDFRGTPVAAGSEDSMRKAARLQPIRKNGKEKRAYIYELDEEVDNPVLYRRESVLDYFGNDEDE